MKIAPITTSFNKNISKPSFGTTYGVENLNKEYQQLDYDFFEKIKEKVSELEEKYPEVDLYFEPDTQEGIRQFCQSSVTRLNFVEKTPQQLKPPKQKFLDRLFDKQPPVLTVPSDLCSITTKINFNATYAMADEEDRTPAVAFEEFCSLVEEGYNKIIGCLKTKADLKVEYPHLSNEDASILAEKFEKWKDERKSNS